MTVASVRTKAVILDAARREFAAHGLAGARVDRIAKLAGANVQRIYAYYTDKQGLFDAVVEDAADDLVAAIGSPADLATFATAVFDFVTQNPDSTRTMIWARLEREEEFFRLMGTRANGQTPISVVARLQDAGLVTTAWDATTIVEAIIALCERWHSSAQENGRDHERSYRELVVGFARTFEVEPAAS
ncbi:TetR/AcrR family transcriptional regulator [Mycetocola zhujimingii]|uniref:TetR/AcrR family transcriptional regulator n=1 Tax=Mycetocola zhujimingii TaxID=2079792 RepID=UPI000D35F077|nr:TetR family transcriptional regulator [Mycetocola zhujimingii]AWB85265.1 TetR family transcriptional regulator [Mycetocola zhujimingii]